MTSKELVQQGKVKEALAALQGEVRAKPNDAKLRVFLFQLLAVLGDWDRAVNQLKVVTDQDAEALLMAQVCGPALAAENLRAEIFAGKRTPLILGKPEEWVSWLVQANKHFADGEYAAATELRDKAFEAAPTVGGTLNGQAFEWIADADQRFGPLLEAIIDGKYYWIPYSHIRELTIEKPSDLRDLVWLPSIMTLAAGAQKIALLPVRYPGTEKTEDGAALLARKTEWLEQGGISVGVGQRIVATDGAEVPLLEVRKLQVNAPVEATEAAAVPAPAEG
ncbi:MAG TPA: type VI secretion system accessory protein TagJ [Phycisphaerae bacterium]|nr:type VI secretion system accessory protein TagJ [Phycisphaerae bacterium]